MCLNKSVYRVETTKIKIINRKNVDDDHGIFYSDPYLFSSFIVPKTLSLCLKNIINKLDFEIEIQYNEKSIIYPITIKDRNKTNYYLYCTNGNSLNGKKHGVIKLMYNDFVYKFSNMSKIQLFFETRSLKSRL